MKRAAVIALVLSSGCFGPGIDGKFECATTGLCPEGYRCEDGACVVGAGHGTDPDAAVNDTPDAGEIDAAEVSVDGAPPPCYGEVAMPIMLGQTVSGDTENAGFDNAGGCNSPGPENYWVLDLDAADLPADITFDALQTNYDLILRIRQGICDDEVAEFVCRDPGEGEIVTRTITVPGPYYIIIDSHGNFETGQYDLTVTAN